MTLKPLGQYAALSIGLLVIGCDRSEPKPAPAPTPAASPSAAIPKPAPEEGVVTDPKTKKRIVDLAKIRGDVPVPEALANTPLAKEFSRNAAPLFKDYGADKMVTVQVMGVSSVDPMARPTVTDLTKKLQLAGSVPAIQMVAKTKTMNMYFAAAPVKDSAAFAGRISQVWPGATTQVDAAKRVITVTPPPTAAPASN